MTGTRGLLALLAGCASPGSPPLSNTATHGPPALVAEVRCYLGTRSYGDRSSTLALRRTVDPAVGVIVEEALPGVAHRTRWLVGPRPGTLRLEAGDRKVGGTMVLAGNGWSSTTVFDDRYEITARSTVTATGLETHGEHRRDDDVSAYAEHLDTIDCRRFEPLRNGFQID